MRFLSSTSVAVTAAALACATIGTNGPASAAFADQYCAEATQYVIAFTALKPIDPAQKVYDAARSVADAYDLCSKRQLSNGNFEPGVHYAFTREASFRVVEARALLALDRPAEAKTKLQDARRIAGDVVDWRYGNSANAQDPGTRTSLGVDGTKDNKRPSLFAPAAKDVVDAADAMLAKLSAVQAAAPAAASSPAPHR